MLMGVTDRVTTNSCAPRRGLVYNPKIILDTIRTSGWLRNKMGCGGFAPFDLHEAFGANRLVAASGMINIWRIILWMD